MVLGIPVAQALTGILNASPNTASGNATLQRWNFTSRLRTGDVFVVRTVLGEEEEIAPGIIGRRSSTVIDNIADDLFPGVASAMPVISMAINPKSVTFDQDKRWTKKDTRNGSVYFHFTNSKGQNNDILTISFSGNTGNLDLRGDLAQPETERTGALLKLKVWHNLYLLTREPILLSDNTVNVFSIEYTSQLLPVPITFRGFFNKVLDFSESADKPNSRDYSFDFTVTSTEPDLDTYLGEVTTALDAVPANATDVSSLFGVGVNSSGG